MGFDLDYDDIMTKPETTKARGLGRFRPKMKAPVPKSFVQASDKNEISESENSTSHRVGTIQAANITTDLPVEAAISDMSVIQCSTSVDFAGKADSLGKDMIYVDDILLEHGTNNGEDPLTLPLTSSDNKLKETDGSLISSSEMAESEFPLHDSKASVPSDNNSSQFVESMSPLGPMSQDLLSTDDLQLHIATSEGIARWDSNAGMSSARKADSMEFVLDPFSDILTESATTTFGAAKKFQPKPGRKKTCPVPKATKEKAIKDPLENYKVPQSDDTINSSANSPEIANTDVLHPEIENSVGIGDWDSFSLRQLTGQNADTLSGMEYHDGILYQSMTSRFNYSHHILTESTLPGNTSMNSQHAGVHEGGHLGPSTLTSTLPGSNIEGESDLPDRDFLIYNGGLETEIENNLKRKSPMAADEGIETLGSKRQLGARIPDSSSNDPEDVHYDGGFPSESYYNNDNNVNEDTIPNNEPVEKRAQRKRKKADPGPEKAKPVRKRKEATKVPDKSAKQPPKKFSHSTRRNKRRVVDKVLLETPDYEIDTQKTPMNQLILLAEIREKNAIKEASTSNIASTSQSGDTASLRDAYNEEEAHDGDPDDYQTGSPPVAVSNGHFNYHTFMDRTPTIRWSKEDTELFYEAVRQFGTDFSMIEQLFPNRNRNQIKLKYKKEERKHPLRLAEAVQNRAKSHSYFQFVIEKLKKDMQAETGQDGVEEDGAEDAPLETNNEEVAKSEQNEQQKNKVEEMDTGDNTQVPTSDTVDKNDDSAQMWSFYESSF